MNQQQLYETVFGEKMEKETYKVVPHNMKGRVGGRGKKMEGGKPYCLKCGLVALNNEYSQWALKVGCLSELHPDNKRMRKRTKPENL